MFLPSVVQSSAHMLCITIMLQEADKCVFEYEGPLADL